MIVLVAKYYVKPGNSDTVAEALRRMAPQVAANEPGCPVYYAQKSTEIEDMFLLYEQYADADALAAHRETPHFQDIIEGQVVPLLDRRERELFELVV